MPWKNVIPKLISIENLSYFHKSNRQYFPTLSSSPKELKSVPQEKKSLKLFTVHSIVPGKKDAMLWQKAIITIYNLNRLSPLKTSNLFIQSNNSPPMFLFLKKCPLEKKVIKIVYCALCYARQKGCHGKKPLLSSLQPLPLPHSSSFMASPSQSMANSASL